MSDLRQLSAVFVAEVNGWRIVDCDYEWPGVRPHIYFYYTSSGELRFNNQGDDGFWTPDTDANQLRVVKGALQVDGWELSILLRILDQDFVCWVECMDIAGEKEPIKINKAGKLAEHEAILDCVRQVREGQREDRKNSS